MATTSHIILLLRSKTRFEPYPSVRAGPLQPNGTALRHGARADISNGFRSNTVTTLAARMDSILQGFGVHRDHHQRGDRIVRSPLAGETIAHFSDADADSVTGTIEQSKMAFLAWATVPCPRQGELVRILGQELRAAKTALGELATIEVGKIAFAPCHLHYQLRQRSSARLGRQV